MRDKFCIITMTAVIVVTLFTVGAVMMTNQAGAVLICSKSGACAGTTPGAFASTPPGHGGHAETTDHRFGSASASSGQGAFYDNGIVCAGGAAPTCIFP